VLNGARIKGVLPKEGKEGRLFIKNLRFSLYMLVVVKEV
jgi:hypothetical protein